MARLHFTGVSTNKLHDELITAGIIPQLVESLGADTWITVDDSQVEAVNDVVVAHDPTPKPSPPDPDEELAAAIQAATTLDELKDALLGKFEKAKVKGKAV
jgi:hypothetical protein